MNEVNAGVVCENCELLDDRLMSTRAMGFYTRSDLLAATTLFLQILLWLGALALCEVLASPMFGVTEIRRVSGLPRMVILVRARTGVRP
jgi:hypothetical protein